ncbi:hypothetical protein Hamer_G014818 [Homarus americanus]|uniref:Uncharacterized protein n=1 Tax=Homarus americanus TaxID=6706 RepID=A0A8J5MNJ1_HOMAM|nr:hypothetical protein Hamer_G014818 [Homarus americanus]
MRDSDGDRDAIERDTESHGVPSSEELVHVLNVSEARWAVVHPDVAPATEAAFSLFPHGTLKKMWVLGNDPTRPCIAQLMTHDPVPPSTKWAHAFRWTGEIKLVYLARVDGHDRNRRRPFTESPLTPTKGAGMTSSMAM